MIRLICSIICVTTVTFTNDVHRQKSQNMKPPNYSSILNTIECPTDYCVLIFRLHILYRLYLNAVGLLELHTDERK